MRNENDVDIATTRKANQKQKRYIYRMKKNVNGNINGVCANLKEFVAV